MNIIYDIRPEDLTIRYNVTQSDQTAVGEYSYTRPIAAFCSFFFLTVNQDYLAQNSTVAVTGNSNLTYQFSIELLADDVVEGNETFSLHLSSSDTRVILNTLNTMITIVNEDRSKLSSMFSVLNHILRLGHLILDT